MRHFSQHTKTLNTKNNICAGPSHAKPRLEMKIHETPEMLEKKPGSRATTGNALLSPRLPFQSRAPGGVMETSKAKLSIDLMNIHNLASERGLFSCLARTLNGKKQVAVGTGEIIGNGSPGATCCHIAIVSAALSTSCCFCSRALSHRREGAHDVLWVFGWREIQCKLFLCYIIIQ